MTKAGRKYLTTEERRSIGSLASQTQQKCLKPINISRVAKSYGIDRATARKWLLEGLKPNPNYDDAPRSGRPPKLLQVQKNAMRRHARHRDTSRTIMDRLVRLHGIEVSLATIQRVLRSGRNPLIWRRIKRGKVLNPANIPKRIDFCERHLHDNFSKWVFLDQFDDHPCYEKDGSASHSWQAQDSPPAPALGRPWSFRMYAAVGLNFKTPLFFTAPSPTEGTKEHKSKGRYNAGAYIQLMRQLKPHLDARYPDGDYIIIQDHASQHTAEVSKAAIKEMGMPVLADYTAQSWDKNIIETVWGVFRGKLRQSKAKTTNGWYAIYRRAWDQIQQSTINKLVAGMQARLESIIEAEGRWVPHH